MRIGKNQKAKEHHKSDLYRIDGGWFACMDGQARLQKNKCTVLSFGVNHDFTFDQEASQDYGCLVHSFDPFIEDEFFTRLRKKNGHGTSSEITLNVDNKWKFHRIGVTDKKGQTRTPEYWMLSLDSILDYTGLKNQVIDILKMDIEGAEEDVLKDLDIDYACKYIKQILLETHPGFKGIPSLLRNRIERCFSLFRRDHRFFLGHIREPVGFITEWQRPVSDPFFLDISQFKDENELAQVLFNLGELYFVNINFLDST